jgi:hypothetical protein
LPLTLKSAIMVKTGRPDSVAGISFDLKLLGLKILPATH